MTCITAKRLGLSAAAALALAGLGAPASAQMRALLPTIEEVEPRGALPIDGVWEIRELGKRIVITDGHAYAEDSWVHMMLFRIEPRQVVIQNIRERGDGSYIAQDLPLMAQVRLEWLGQDTLRASTEGLIPVTYHLEMVSSGGPGSDWRGPGIDLPPIEAPPAVPGDEDDDYVAPW